MKILAITALAALALGAGQALAAGSRHAAPVRTFKVVMHDPGCHWFQIGGKDVKTASVAGAVRLLNYDIGTLKVASRTGMKLVPVGKSRVFGRGHYVVMMVGQAVDDNYLKLTVR